MAARRCWVITAFACDLATGRSRNATAPIAAASIIRLVAAIPEPRLPCFAGVTTSSQ